MSDSLEADEPSDLGFMCSPFSTAPLPVAAHPALASSHLSHFRTRLTCAVLFFLQGLPLALGPLWGAGSPHPLSPSSLLSLWPQYVPGSSQQASPRVLAARCRLLRFLTLWPVEQRWTSPQPPLSVGEAAHLTSHILGRVSSSLLVSPRRTQQHFSYSL